MFIQRRAFKIWLSLILLLEWPFKGLQSAVPVEQPEISAAATSSSSANAPDAMGRVMYDQRQTGKYNIHVSIKDVAIIEMEQKEQDDDVYDDTDYYYDEADLTVKPLTLSPTTVKSTTFSNNATKISTTTESLLNLDKETEVFTTHLPISALITDVTDAATVDYSNITTLLADNDEQTEIEAQNYITKHPKISTISNLPQKPLINEIKSTTPALLLKESRADAELRVPESTIYKFKVPQQQEHVEKLKERLRQQFLQQNKAIPNRNALQQEPLIKHILQQQSKQFHKQNLEPLQHSHLNVRYPTPMHVLHAHRCRTNQFRDMTGNCQNRRTSSNSNSAASILKTLFNMFVALPLANMREHD